METLSQLWQYYDAFRENWGHTVIIPLSRAIRECIEGSDAPRGPTPDIRYVEPKSWFVDHSDYVAIVVMAAIFTALEPILMYAVKKLITEKLRMNELDTRRFQESFWQFCFYTPVWAYNFYILSGSHWFYNTYLVWEPPFPFQPMPTEIWVLYILQLGWYLHCSYDHILYDRRKSDFWAMMIHHLVTLILLYSAFSTGYYRCGVLCMFSLDICDTFLHWTKCIRLADNWYTLNDSVKVGTYLSVVVSWMVFRLFLFPYKVLYTASFQGMDYGGWPNADYWLFYNGLLFVIFILQVYWFYLILLSGYKYVRFGDELDDQRDLSNEGNIKAEKARGSGASKKKKQ